MTKEPAKGTKSGRFRIPAAIVKQVGMKIGSRIQANLFNMTGVTTFAKFPHLLKVHADGRIDFPRDCILINKRPIADKPLKTFVDANGLINFELA